MSFSPIAIPSPVQYITLLPTHFPSLTTMIRQSLLRLTRASAPAQSARTFSAAAARMGEGDTGAPRSGGVAQRYERSPLSRPARGLFTITTNPETHPTGPSTNTPSSPATPSKNAKPPARTSSSKSRKSKSPPPHHSLEFTSSNSPPRLKELKARLDSQRAHLAELEKNIDEMSKEGGGEQN